MLTRRRKRLAVSLAGLRSPVSLRRVEGREMKAMRTRLRCLVTLLALMTILLSGTVLPVGAQEESTPPPQNSPRTR